MWKIEIYSEGDVSSRKLYEQAMPPIYRMSVEEFTLWKLNYMEEINSCIDRLRNMYAYLDYAATYADYSEWYREQVTSI